MAGARDPAAARLSVLVAAIRARLRRGRGRPRERTFRRERIGGVVRIHGTLVVAGERWPAVARAVAAAVAEAVDGGTLGQASLVAGEPPIVASFAGRRDVVAPRVVAALTAGQAHRRPALWLRLAPGAYLAEVVDPELPLAGGSGELAALVAVGGRAAAALLTVPVPHGGDVALRLELFAPLPLARALLRQGRRHLAAVRPAASQR